MALEKSLHGVLIPNSDIQHLFFVPGIGKITAFTVYLEIDGIERFDSDKHFLSYCRLVPAADNSNRRFHQKSSKDGNKYLKIAFSDAAVHAVQYYPEIKAFYILKNKSPYKGFKGLPISRQKSQSAAGGPRLPNPDA